MTASRGGLSGQGRGFISAAFLSTAWRDLSKHAAVSLYPPHKRMENYRVISAFTS